MSVLRQFCSFFVAGQQFGIEVERVQEIIRYQATTRVPLAPHAVSGLINLRGQIVPVVDLRACLGLPALRAELLPTNVVLRTDEGSVSLSVDEIGDVLEVSDTDFEGTPENLHGVTRELLRGVYKLRDGLLLVLGVESAIEHATRPNDETKGRTHVGQS
jgi:purine-binding chemotaxis protein CheW